VVLFFDFHWILELAMALVVWVWATITASRHDLRHGEKASPGDMYHVSKLSISDLVKLVLVQDAKNAERSLNDKKLSKLKTFVHVPMVFPFQI
jgi:hypothetical protein